MSFDNKSRPHIDPYLAVIVLIASIGGALLVVKARNWALMTDELLYGEMARDIAGSFVPLPQARGELIHVNQLLYPLLISPIVGLFSMPDAYPVVAVLNAIVMATAAIPVYLFTKYASGSVVAARWVAACAVCLPWLAFASKMLPDALAYTAMLWTLYAIARTADGREEPSGERSCLRGDTLVLLAILLTFLVRNQFIALLPIWLAVVGLRRIAVAIPPDAAATFGDRARAIWRAIWRTPLERPLPFFALVVVYLAVRLEPTWTVGIYTAAASGSQGQVAPDGVFGALIDHLGVIGVALGGLPLVLALPWLSSALVRIRSVAENQSALVIFVASLVLLFVGASFNQRFGNGLVLERYVFYVAPLLLIAAGCLLVKPPNSLGKFALPALLGIVLLAVVEPYGLDSPVTIDANHGFSPSQIGLILPQRLADALGSTIFNLMFVVIVAVAGVAWLLQLRGRVNAALALAFGVTLSFLFVTTVYSVDKAVYRQNQAVDRALGARTADQKTWIDASICASCSAALVFTPLISVGPPDRASAAVDASKGSARLRPDLRPDERFSTWWDLEFWNSRIDSLHVAGFGRPGVASPTFGPIRDVSVNWQSGAIDLEQADDSEYMVVAKRNPFFQPQPITGSRPIANRSGFTLYEVGPEPTAAWATSGLTRLGWIPPAGATLRLWSPTSATSTTSLNVLVRLASTKVSGLDRLVVENADVTKYASGSSTVYRWRTQVPANGRVDFSLAWRGAKASANAHVEEIVVSPRLLGFRSSR